MKYKAIFFDRDGTLTYFNPEKELWRDKTIEAWSGKQFELPYEKMMELFRLASEGKCSWLIKKQTTHNTNKDSRPALFRSIIITTEANKMSNLFASVVLFCGSNQMV